MTIASAFNEIAVANGGTADNSGTIAGAVDALTDALAGSDVAQGATIEDGVRVLGEYIGGGGGSLGKYLWSEFYTSPTAPEIGGQMPDEEYMLQNELYDGNGDVVVTSAGIISSVKAGFYTPMTVSKLPQAAYAVASNPSGITVADKLPIDVLDVEGESFKLVKLPDYDSNDGAVLVFVVPNI